jgi:single-stranded-DNA-specific exonuclease
MIITAKRVIADDPSFDEQKIINLLLKDRGIEDMDTFLNPPDPSVMSIADFGYEKELTKTLSLLEDVKKKGGTVVVYTDYDADGITGGTILWETLHLLGFKAMPYVPHRKTEGYGFSIKGIDNVKEQYNPSVIISVDHGITAAEKITYAKEKLGIPIVVTDHHLKSDTPPDDAYAVFHLPQISGSGVSYFFSKALFEHFKDQATPGNREKLTRYFKTDYLSLASIGTIADLVPLVGPARSIAKFGLAAFPHVTREGIRCIMNESGIEGKKITPYEVGFIIAPRINAVGRLEHALEALRLLCTTSSEKAQQIASSVGRTNKERQDLVKEAVTEAKQQVESLHGNTLPKILVLTSESWHEGIIGLIASKMVEQYWRPVIVMTASESFLKGSARSVPTVHITEFLRSLKKHLVDVGGHMQAAGFTIEKDKLAGFIKAVEKASGKIVKPTDLERRIEADVTMPLSKVTSSLLTTLEQLQPFGIGNPQPVFLSTVTLQDARIFGKKNEHLRILVGDKSNGSLELIAFSKAADFHKLALGQEMKIIYQPEINRWNGTSKLQGKLSYWE